jgi:hypothetical protein
MYFLQEPANSKSKKIHKQTNEGGEKNENEALRSLICRKKQQQQQSKGLRMLRNIETTNS